VGKPLRTKLRQREPLTREEKIYAVFGALSGLWTVLALGLMIATLGGYALRFAQTPPGMVVVGLLVLFFGYRWGARRVRRWRVAARKKAAA
jgi:uncharacterized membrane protein